MNLTKKHVRDARLVGIKAHGSQDYDGIFPYEKHLEDVVGILKRFGIVHPKYICGAYLHDAMEDGSLSYNKVKIHFGVEVAEMVFCVTDELGRNRREKKAKTLPKTASNPDAIILKLADRIANVEHGGKVDMYFKEFDEFKRILHQPDRMAEPLWSYLEELLNIFK